MARMQGIHPLFKYWISWKLHILLYRFTNRCWMPNLSNSWSDLSTSNKAICSAALHSFLCLFSSMHDCGSIHLNTQNLVLVSNVVQVVLPQQRNLGSENWRQGELSLMTRTFRTVINHFRCHRLTSDSKLVSCGLQPWPSWTQWLFIIIGLRRSLRRHF